MKCCTYCLVASDKHFYWFSFSFRSVFIGSRCIWFHWCFVLHNDGNNHSTLAVLLLLFRWFGYRSHFAHSAQRVRLELVRFSTETTETPGLNDSTVAAKSPFHWIEFGALYIGHIRIGASSESDIEYFHAEVNLNLFFSNFQLIKSSISYYLAFDIISDRA